MGRFIKGQYFTDVILLFSNGDLERYLSNNEDCDRLGGVVLKRQPRMREVVGLIPGQVIQNTLKMVVLMVALLGAQDCGVVLVT